MNNYLPAFPDEEYAARIERVRQKMTEERLDVCVLSVPESICYPTGLNHWGFFGLHLLLVPLEGDLCLIARAMERVTVETQLASKVQFYGYKDDDKPAIFAAQILKTKGLSRARIGMDFDTLYRSYHSTKRLLDQLPDADFVDSQEFMDRLRFVKSPLEIAAMRQAATISERMMEAAIKVTSPGVNERTIAAEVLKEMILAGGELPSFGPFIRPMTRLGEEHGTWGGDFLAANDTLFVELAGCYKRYRAPLGRFIYTSPPSSAERVQEVCLEAFKRVTRAMKPGVTADAVYSSWPGRSELAPGRGHTCAERRRSPPSQPLGPLPAGLRPGGGHASRAGQVARLPGARSPGGRRQRRAHRPLRGHAGAAGRP